MIPEVGWMFEDDLTEETIAALVCMEPVQWALVAFVHAGGGEPVQ